IELIQFCPQFSFAHQSWPFRQIPAANARVKNRVTPRVANHTIFRSVTFDRTNRWVTNQLDRGTRAVVSQILRADSAAPSKRKADRRRNRDSCSGIRTRTETNNYCVRLPKLLLHFTQAFETR